MASRIDGNGATHALRAVLDHAIEEYGGGLGTWTVLAAANDPYRADVPRFREAGEWFAGHWERLGSREDLHFRGYHYALLGEPKPNGEPYRNTAKDWVWIQEDAGDGARWLGLVPFDAIKDQRNAVPIRRNVTRIHPEPLLTVGEVEVNLPETLDPQVRLPNPGNGERLAIQPYRLAIFGEKVSLESVVGPIAAQRGASLYLPTGESSDSMVYWLMRDAAEDGRPLVVFYLADCDPAGHQMATSVSRKMQAFRDLLFPDVEYELYSVALTPEQVVEYGLPSDPLKDTEKRAAKWKAAFGIDGTEIDALATLRPRVLRRLLAEALDGFYDHTLDQRVEEARDAWEQEQQQRLVDHLGPEQLAEIRTKAEDRLADLDELVDEINDALTVEVEGVEFAPFEVPEPEDREYGLPDTPVISSDWDYAEQTRRLQARKAYEVKS
jgi:hypothetical protein